MSDMRYINLRRIEPSSEWKEKAQQALDDVINLPRKERIGAINQKSSIWREMKDKLREYSHDKCWYCESKLNRADWSVDHFRPKGRVFECQDHEGYWWLAFCWDNFRFSCTYCNSRRRDRITANSGGKHDHFPLINENRRARTPEDDVEAEYPCLLDPTKVSDPGLLWFNQNGEVVPKFSMEQSPTFHRRAEKSINLYNLNYYKTSEKRKILHNSIAQLVKDGNRYFNKYYFEKDCEAEYGLNRVMETLLDLLDEDAEYSAATRSYLNGLKSTESQWLDAIMNTCL